MHQLGKNRAPGASATVTQVSHSVHSLSTFLRIRADPSMQIFGSLSQTALFDTFLILPTIPVFTQYQAHLQICSLYLSFGLSVFFFIYFTITGVTKIVRYTGDFVLLRFVISRFHCNLNQSMASTHWFAPFISTTLNS